jgi:hypothetical protein
MEADAIRRRPTERANERLNEFRVHHAQVVPP